MKTASVITVSQLNFYVKTLLENEPVLHSLYISGEISNFTNHYKTGHLYFTLKDNSAAIKAVMFRSSAERLRFVPENGMKVIIRGRVSVYERDGQYQLYCDDMQPDGVGALAVAFEQLKKKLEEQGLFDSKYKKALPPIPMNIGVITSPTGAAVRDIINVIGRRFPLATITLYPVLVQGQGSAAQLCEALYYFNSDSCEDRPQVIIIGRGGGSIEDLWSFNEEIVARAVFESDIPVISAVGHETDFTICDFVADLRAPTPSAAAELAVPDCAEHRAFCRSVPSRCAYLLKKNVEKNRAELKSICSSPVIKRPLEIINIRRLELDSLILSVSRRESDIINKYKTDFSSLCAKLDALSPFKVLSRGYALVSTPDGKAATGIDAFSQGDTAKIRMKDGSLDCKVTKKEKIGCVDIG